MIEIIRPSIHIQLTPEQGAAMLARLEEVYRVSTQTPTGSHSAEFVAARVEVQEWAPLEFEHVTAEVICSIACREQMIRQRFFRDDTNPPSSGRPTELAVISSSLRYINLGKRGELQIIPPDGDLPMVFGASVGAFDAYCHMVRSGCKPEVARGVLPLWTACRFLLQGDLHSWLLWLRARMEKHAQQEHRDLAWDAWRQFRFAGLGPVFDWLGMVYALEPIPRLARMCRERDDRIDELEREIEDLRATLARTVTQ